MKQTVNNDVIKICQLCCHKPYLQFVQHIRHGSTLQQKNVLQNRILSMKQLFNNKKRPTK